MPPSTRAAAVLVATGFLFLYAAAAEPPARDAQIGRLRADLAWQSATQVLTRRCAALGFAVPPVIRALRVHAPDKTPSRDTRTLLGAQGSETIRYRRVQLTCGQHILSEADNWYLPDKLTANMNRTLDTTDTPFGAVVKPLAFHRKTLEAVALAGPQPILRVRALLITEKGVPFSLVIENYGCDLLAAKQHDP